MASDGESDEDFVTYGTPLEPYEEDEPIRKPIPVQDQTVKDEKGRYKRFHGAFTGGFSAGYFNSVGSKEGWTPSTFVSSRQQKSDRQNAARPEDFMDEEDFSEHGIAPREITTTDDFASGRPDRIKEKAKAITSLMAPIPGDTLLDELIAPARSSIGVQLLRSMGWKDGQGVGPRLKRRQRKQEPDIRVYGCALPPTGSEESEEDDDEFAPENVTFAPKDVMPVDFTPKDDLHGLGYRGLDPLLALSGGSGSGHINLFTLDSDRTSSLFGGRKARKQREGGISGQAFGVGAMEEEDDDIYHRDAMSNYDTVLGGEEKGDGLYGWTAPREYSKKKNDSKRDAAYVGKILEGFTLASQLPELKTVFPPPDVPRDFRPVHYFRPVVDLSSVSPVVAQALQASRGHMSQDAPQQGRHALDSAQRRQMLGESTLQGPSSVFELMDSKDRERLSEIRKAAEDKKTTATSGDMTSAEGRAAVVAAAKASALQALSSRFLQSGAPQGASQAAPRTADADQMALSAWSGPTADASKTFRPFEKNPDKQARYDLYISRLKQGDKDALETSLDLSMTEWERGRERDEFVRAAVLYKPSNSSLSSRFTRGKHEDNTDSVEVARDQENDVDDKQTAVKMKMFGKLTRDTFEWHPDKLLCKRFNVPDPYSGSGIVGLPKVKRDKFSVFNFLNVAEEREGSRPSASSSSSSSSVPGVSSSAATGKRSRWDVASQEPQVKDPLSRFISEARSEASATANSPTAASATSVDSEAKPAEPVAEETERTNTEKEEEAEEEEVRPSMDLFKAIFASSSDEKSSSSEVDSAEEEEEEEQEAEPEIQTSISMSAPPLSTQAPPTSSFSTAAEAKPPSERRAENDGVPASSAKAGELDSEEFGPRLPPPGQVFATPSLPPRVERRRKTSRDKKERKLRKEKKHKKKSKKHKHKSKQKKKKKKAEETDSSSDDTDSDSDEVVGSGDVSTQELLQRLTNLRGHK